MFSNIKDAWGNDPVKEITDKLSKGAFQTNTDHENVFNFKTQNLIENRKRINENDILSLSDNISLSLASENTDIPKSISFSNSKKKSYSNKTNTHSLHVDKTPDLSDIENYSTYAPANYDKYFNNKKEKKSTYRSKHPSITSINITDTDTDTSNIINTTDDSKCSYSSKHLKKCDRCYYKLKKLVDNKITKKIDDIILDNKMKQLEAFSLNNLETNLQKNNNISSGPSWEKHLIIVIGVLIAILIIFLIFRCMR